MKRCRKNKCGDCHYFEKFEELCSIDENDYYVDGGICHVEDSESPISPLVRSDEGCKLFKQKPADGKEY